MRVLLAVSRLGVAALLTSSAASPAFADATSPDAPSATIVAVAGHEAPLVNVTAPDGTFAIGTITTSLDPLAYTNVTATGIRYSTTVGAQTASIAYLVGDDTASTVANLYGLDYLVRTGTGTIALSGGNGRDGLFGGVGFGNSTKTFGYDVHVTKTATNESAALSTTTKLGAVSTSVALHATHEETSALAPDASALATPVPAGMLHVDGGVGLGVGLNGGRSVELKLSSALDGTDTSDGAALSYTQRYGSGGYVLSVGAKDRFTSDGLVQMVTNDVKFSQRIVSGVNATLGLGAASTTATDPTYALAGISANAKAGLSYATGPMRFATTIDRGTTRAASGLVTPTSGVRYDVTLGPTKKLPFHATASVTQRYGATSVPVQTIQIQVSPSR
jgi:hypothetical protein